MEESKPKFAVRVMKDSRGYFKPDEIDRLLLAAEKPRDKLLLRILARSGRRITEVVGRKKYIHRNARLGIEHEYCEVIGIRPMDIFYDEGAIEFPILKKKAMKRELKAIDNETIEMIRDYIIAKDIKDDENIFKIGRFRAIQIVREVAHKIGIDKLGEKKPHPHNFRHSFAVNIIKKSTKPQDLRMLQQILEHSNLEVTSQYLKFSQEEQKAMIERAFN